MIFGALGGIAESFQVTWNRRRMARGSRMIAHLPWNPRVGIVNKHMAPRWYPMCCRAAIRYKAVFSDFGVDQTHDTYQNGCMFGSGLGRHTGLVASLLPETLSFSKL